MHSPFRSEADAFQFVLLTVAAFAAVAVSSLLGGPWAGVPVWGLVTAAVAFLYLRRRLGRPVKTAPAHVGAVDERRILVIANETPPGKRLVQEIEQAAAGRRAQVLVVSPALVSHVRHWTSDLDAAQAQAEQRLEATLGPLRTAGIDVRGAIGDEDPRQAIDDALRSFGADAIIITTHPEERSYWSERDIVPRARDHYALPITQLVIDGEVTA